MPYRSASGENHNDKETPVDTVETDTTCSYCSVGCSLKLESCGDMLIKANPDKEGTVNQGLACGKGKWGFDCSMLENKLEEPLIKKKMISVKRIITKPL